MRRYLAAAGLAVLVTGCGLVAGLGGEYRPAADAGTSAIDGGGGGDSGGDGAAGDAAGSADGRGSDAEGGASFDAGRCNPASNHGPTMIEVPTSAGSAPSFCIDSTEVTQAHYGAFLGANPIAAQGPPCAENATYLPGGDAPSGCFAYAVNTASSAPVTCLDWCDAKAFCAWAGKELCGKLGGGDVDFGGGEGADIQQSQWFAACTANDPPSHPFPWGGAPDNGQCFSSLASPAPTGPAPVGSKASCEVLGLPPLFDMAGNVAEWEDSCDGKPGAAPDQPCRARGGDYAMSGNGLRCDALNINPKRKATDIHVGFRCCAN